jgi:group I intron endonuclease
MKFIYQEHSLKPGIYKILNTHTNRIYIGQAERFKERWKAHASSFRLGKHRNKFMMSDFRKCLGQIGNDDFLEFHVVEVMEGSTKEERNAREEEWIGQFADGKQHCYNIELKPTKPPASCWSKTPEETSRRRSQAHKGKRYSPNTEFQKGTAHSGYGKPLSEATRIRLSESNKGKHNPSEATRELIRQANLGSNNPNFGKPKSSEVKEKLAKAHQFRAKTVQQFTKEGVFIALYYSAAEAGRKTFVSGSNIIGCCKGRIKSSGGFLWKYLE